MKATPFLFVAAFASLTLPAAMAADKTGGTAASKEPAAVELKTLEGADAEVAFLADMIHHHKDGVAMAKLALENSKDQHLKEMNQKMISDQETEINQMAEWLNRWHQKKPEDHAMHAESKAMAEEHMQKLKNAKGADFDKTFLKTMIQHHQGAVEMAKAVVEKTNKAELKELAQKIITSQSQEIEHMEAMLKQ